MKKSYELKSLAELGLPAYAAAYVRNKIGDCPEEIVFYGREIAFNHEGYGGFDVIEPKSIRLLVEALDREGFIRHDLSRDCNHYRMVCLIKAILGSHKSPPFFVFELPYESGNRAYEAFEDISDERFEQFKSYIKSSATDREYKVLVLRFALDGDWKMCCLESCAKQLSYTKERVRQIEAIAIRKLARHEGSSYCLRLFLLSDNEIRQEIAELKRKLYFIGKLELIEDLDENEVFKMTSIDEIGLSYRTWTSLKRAGVETVSDILEHRKDNYSRIRNLCVKSVSEIEDKIKNVVS